MDMVEKVKAALKSEIDIERFDLLDDDGVIGYVVSKDFEGLNSIERQTLIQKALRSGKKRLSKTDVRRVAAIASLTPDEFIVWSA